LLEGIVDRPVDTATHDALSLADYLEQRPQLARMIAKDVFPNECAAAWRQGVDGVPVRVWGSRLA
jgi:hypothetical protein